MASDLRQTVLQILVDQLKLPIDPATVTNDKTIEDLGIHSLHLMNLVYEVEETFEVSLDTRAMLELNTLGDLLALLEEKIDAPQV